MEKRLISTILFILLCVRRSCQSADDSCYTFQIWRPEEDVLRNLRNLELKCDNVTYQLEREVLKTRNELLLGLKQYQNWSANLEREVMNLRLEQMETKSLQSNFMAELTALQAEVEVVSEKSNNLKIDYLDIRSRLSGSISNVRGIENTAELLEEDANIVSVLKAAVGDLKGEWLLMKRDLIAQRDVILQLKNGQYNISKESTALKQQYQAMKRRNSQVESTTNQNSRNSDVIRHDVNVLKQDLVGIKKSQSDLHVNFRTIDSDISSLKASDSETRDHVVRFRSEIIGYIRRLVADKQDIDQTLKLSTTLSETDAIAADCQDVYLQGHSTSGVYYIKPKNAKYADQVYCEISNDGGYTVIQRRTDGTIGFNRGWLEYKFGFGNLYSDHWLGNQFLHLLTSQQNYILRVDIWDWEGARFFAEYSTFGVDNSSENFMLHLGGYSGTAGDSLSYHNGMKFSTEDQDNDLHVRNCAAENKGGWWYNSCYTANLNGLYHSAWYSQEESTFADGVVWYTLKESDKYSLRKVEMKLRRPS